MPGKSEKFFFDMNVFDENGMELRELEANKPPPTFSREELEAARRAGFEQGRKQGFEESQASINKQTEKTLERISQETAVLFQAEDARENIYEQESTRLAFALLKKLFPLWNEKLGLDELKKSLTDILQKTGGMAKIVISVRPDASEEIKKHIDSFFSDEGKDHRFEIRGDDSLGPGDCRLSWSDGGAIRDTGNMADKILNLMEEALAAQGGSVHDRTEEGKGTDAPGTNGEHEAESESGDKE